MQKQKGISTLVGIIIIVVVAIVLFGAVFAYQYFSKPQTKISNVQTNPNSQKNLSENEATNLVANMPEVKKWLSLFSGSSNGQPMIAVDHKDDKTYFIHVYENLLDHNATFNWYDVDIETGKITPEFSK